MSLQITLIMFNIRLQLIATVHFQMTDDTCRIKNYQTKNIVEFEVSCCRMLTTA